MYEYKLGFDNDQYSNCNLIKKFIKRTLVLFGSRTFSTILSEKSNIIVTIPTIKTSNAVNTEV